MFNIQFYSTSIIKHPTVNTMRFTLLFGSSADFKTVIGLYRLFLYCILFMLTKAITFNDNKRWQTNIPNKGKFNFNLPKWNVPSTFRVLIVL